MDFAARPMEVFTHKFFTPISYPGAIQRDELLARLFRAPAHGALVLQAPAGPGKSTLLQQAKPHDQRHATITAWLPPAQAHDEKPPFHGPLPEPGSKSHPEGEGHHS